MCKQAVMLKKWKEWLCGEDVHSVQQQIYRMMWDAAVFNLVKKARELAPKNEDDDVQWNQPISEFMLKAYFETQAMAIRRLLDCRDDVTSLGRLVKKLKENQHLLTRENILMGADCPYKYKDVLEQRNESGISGPELARAGFAEAMHIRIDVLTGVDMAKRKPTDRVNPEVVELLRARVAKTEGTCADISTYVNKFLAHCATAESRKNKDADDIKLTLGKISEAQRTLCETAAFIAKYLLGEDFGQFVVSAGHDIFEHLTTPLATKEALPVLQQEWEDYETNTQRWADWDWQSEYATHSGGSGA